MEVVDIYTDGSFHKKSGKASWAFIVYKNGEATFNAKGVLEGEINSMWQVGGEMAGIVNAIKYCKKHNLKANLFYDLQNLFEWVADHFGKKKAWNTGTKWSQYYRDFVIKNKDHINSWNKIKSHSGVTGNELADHLCSEAIKQYEKEKYLKSLIGNKIGNWTLLDFFYKKSGNTQRYPVFRCKCACGGLSNVSYYKFNVQKNCKKCGYIKNRGKRNSNWSGFEEMPGTLFSSIKRNCIRFNRELKFDLTKEYLWTLYISQDRKCAISGVPLIFGDIKTRKRTWNISLDRIDNSKGYVLGNVRWVDKNINLMRRLLSDENFLWYCEQVVSFQNKKIISKKPDLLNSPFLKPN